MSKAWLPDPARPSLGSPLPPGSVRPLPGVHPWLPDPVRPFWGIQLGVAFPGRAGGAYNLAWHALGRPTPFSFATVNKTKFTSPPGHTMWGAGITLPLEGPPRPITPCSSPGCIEAPGGRLSDFGGDGRPCQRAGVRRARSLGCAGWPRVGRTSRAGSGGRVSVGLDNSGS